MDGCNTVLKAKNCNTQLDKMKTDIRTRTETRNRWILYMLEWSDNSVLGYSLISIYVRSASLGMALEDCVESPHCMLYHGDLLSEQEGCFTMQH